MFLNDHLADLCAQRWRELAEVYNGYTYFADGDLCIAKITPCFENGKGALAEGLTHGVGFGTTELHIVRPGPSINRRFLFYISIASDFRKLGESEMYGAGGQKRIDEGFIKDWMPPLPPLDTQRRIAHFLDEKTARIDGLIEKKRALLDRLAEKRQALITRAVTKGLNPDAPMKPSGIDWLGDIPAHWDCCGLGQKIKLQRGVDITRDERVEGPFPVISSGGIDYFHDTALCNGPGVIVGRKGSAGKLHYVENDFWPHDTTLYVREFRGNHPKFTWYMLNILDLTSFDTGSSNPTVNRNRVHPMRTAWPPPCEQADIVARLDDEFEAIATLDAEVAKSVRYLQEYRSALITAAVTGKIAELR